MDNDVKWFALRVRSRFEKAVAVDLAARGYEVCAACAPQRRVWADRVRTADMPMFPGYIFARFNPAQGPLVLRASGVVSIVGFGHQYCQVEEAEIDSIRILMTSGIQVQRESEFRPGAQVRVLCGSLRGLEGTLEQVKNKHRLVVTVTLLQRSVAVEIDEAIVDFLPGQLSSTKNAAA
jgi:transcription antitermination factor NusG